VCGIAGIVSPPGSGVSPDVARAMSASLIHRGPDDSGYLGWTPGGDVKVGGLETVTGARVGFVHRRLSILDLTERGRQPMQSSCGRYALIYNGEVYNYRELRCELQQSGHQFHTETDTEVVLAAWAAWGPTALTRFVGMFAFALLDSRTEQLFLVRDPFGMKPLFYASTPGGFVFASEIKAILAMPGVARAADPQTAYEFLRFAVTDRSERTFFAAIHQVRPAHFVTVSLAGDPPAPVRYWKARLEPSTASFEEAASILRDRFIESVSLHLRADVPVGAALSGGVDSSAVVAAMRLIQGSDLELHTFTYAAGDGAPDEERWASLVARDVKAIRHVCRLDAGDLTADLRTLIHAQDEPFVTSSVFAQYRVFRAAGEAGIKVTLDGQGADEYMAGYPSFVTGRLASLIRRGQLGDAWTFARGAAGGHPLARAIGLMLPPAVRGTARQLAGHPDFPAWLNASWFESKGVSVPAFGAVTTADAMIEQLQEALADISLPMLLRYADRDAMAHSIESRMPFLTTSLVEFCMSLPEEYLLAQDGTTKAVFRAAMRGIVPDAILDRRDKVGFLTPERQWMQSRSAFDSHIDGHAGAPACLNTAALNSLWERAATGAPEAVGAAWRAMNLVEWSEALAVEWQ
jgi:asparagine synthase (glutamine-hydrolysing)